MSFPSRLLPSQARGLAGSLWSLTGAGFFHPSQVIATTAATLRWGPSMAALFEAAKLRHPYRLAVIDDWGAATFEDLSRVSGRLAAGLAAQGVNQDARVGILCRNSRAFVVVALAAAKLGAQTVYLNTASAGPQLNQILINEGVTFVVHDAEYVIDQVPAATVLPNRNDSWWFPTISDSADLSWSLPPLRPKLPVLLTSGTTGVPKGAKRGTPKPDINAATALLQRVPYGRDQTIATSSPLFHAWGAAHLGLATALGATLVLRARFDPAECLADIVEHDVNLLATVPVFVQDLLASPGAAPVLKRLDAAVSSGAALPSTVAREWLETVGPSIYNVYGSTEVGQATIASPTDLANHPGTVGQPAAGCTVTIFDRDRHPVGAGVVGSIFVGSGLAFDGYSSGGSKEAVGSLLSTGDTGYFTPDGCLMVTGRDDEMIITGGENVFPNEIEDCIRSLNYVTDVAVVGVPDSKFGQRLVAVVVADSAAKPSAKQRRKQIQAAVRNELATYKIPRDVLFVDSLPRNPAGKVLRQSLAGKAQDQLRSAD